MTSSPDRRKPTWKYVATTLVGFVILITMTLYAGTSSDIKDLQKSKLDKQEYYKDYREMNERLKKIDDIYNYLLQHRHATERK